MDYKKRKSMQTALLWEIRIVLRHNFFQDIAAQLPAEFPTDAPYDVSKDEQIARLTAKNEKPPYRAISDEGDPAVETAR